MILERLRSRHRGMQTKRHENINRKPVSTGTPSPPVIKLIEFMLMICNCRSDRI